jgi:hypothetical protein
VELALACKPLKVAIPEDKKKFDRLKANLEKMGCAGLLDVTWHHEEPAWLQEIWKRDRSAFPNTVRADPGSWREELLGEIFGLNRDWVSLPYKVKGHNLAVGYFTKKANPKEGWKFSECTKEELRDLFEFLTPLINPMKQSRITNKFASTVVSCLYFGKPVSWAQVLAEVLAQQVRLMGPNNVRVCLSGYLAPIYAAKKVLTRREAQSYRYTIQGGDPEAEKDKEEE